MKKQIACEGSQHGSSISPVQEPVPGYFSELNHRHATESATMAASQTNTWRLVEDGLLADYRQVCSNRGGLVKEVATLRSHLQKLILLDLQYKQDNAKLGEDQALEKATLSVSIS